MFSRVTSFPTPLPGPQKHLQKPSPSNHGEAEPAAGALAAAAISSVLPPKQDVGSDPLGEVTSSELAPATSRRFSWSSSGGVCVCVCLLKERCECSSGSTAFSPSRSRLQLQAGEEAEPLLLYTPPEKVSLSTNLRNQQPLAASRPEPPTHQKMSGVCSPSLTLEEASGGGGRSVAASLLHHPH